MELLALFLVLLIASTSSLNPERVIFPDEFQRLQDNKKICAIANIAEGGFTGMRIGQVLFTQESSDAPVHITGNIHSLSPGKHGFHIHQYGSTEEGCTLARGHFNPFSVTHGARQSLERHVGDLGNILANNDGIADFTFTDEIISLHLGSTENVIGRAVVVHAGEDDLGQGGTVASFKTGNAGGRAGCGVIALVPCSAKLQKSQGLYAMASLYKDSMSAKGMVTFSQESPTSPVVVRGSVTLFQLYTSSLHGFHIHEFGDTSDACKAAGGHFNPTGVNHGAPTDAVRHVGDLGNIKDENGTAQFCIVDSMISLYPGVNSIIGRAVVVHQNEDDLGKGGDEGSAASGNAGPRLTCGAIGYVDKDYLKETIPPSLCV